ncbi:hypothetical protein VPHK389_0073 [Vibrio phage K389]
MSTLYYRQAHRHGVILDLIKRYKSCRILGARI